ncbi:ribokinase [Cellulomonas timonensis]|uniref:ribokinase n=1 Tax=Cellulomonas timonensis TaxID=1689271 RepID=UPI000837389A|nr:ribokinase [Cellulomonas timonensis]
MKPERFDVTVVGSVNIDLVASVDDLPRPGETVSATGYAQFLGGKGSNQAIAAARLGRRVAFVGLTGDDAEAAEVRTAMSREGIDTRHLGAASETPTGRALVLVDSAAENSIVVVAGANGHVSARHVEDAGDTVADAAVVVAQLEIPLAAVLAASRAARGAFVLNPAPAQALPAEILDQVDVLVVNEIEYEAVTGRPLPADIDALARELAADTTLTASVVVTVGERGAFVWDGHELTHVTAPRVAVVDTTGAGDTFIGALADALSRGEDLVTAARWAAHAGAVSVGSLGATTGMPRPEAVHASLSQSAEPPSPPSEAP